MSRGMRNALAASMRPSTLGILAINLVLSVPAFAGSSGGGQGGGRGRLGQVSSGLGTATGSSNSSSTRGSSSSSSTVDYDCDHTAYYRDERCLRDVDAEPTVIVDADGTRRLVPRVGAKVHGYAGAQKVHESDGSVSLELSIVDKRFRLNGALTHYFEQQMDGGRLTMTMPSLTVGVRIDDLGPTGVWLEGGVVNARTQGDAMGDSTTTGPVFGTRVEHRLSRRTSLLGVAEAMLMKHDVRAYGGRVGVRFGHFQASFRYIDFNVGPALYGPELGMRF